MKARLFPLLVCALAVAGVAARSATPGQEPRLAPPASRLEIDALFAPWDKKDSPGCALGVFRDGAMAYQRGYGMASLEHDVPITPDSVFYAGSVSKQFTAMAAALAMQQGKLSYDDPIRKYLTELPPYADAIKVRHLIHHTSGLRDYNTLLAIAGRRDEDAWDNRAVLQMTARQTQLNFTPGDEYLYSNTGYTLLATIVERATGVKFAAFADANIFTPLGMHVSHYHVDATRLVRNRALGYGVRAGQWMLDTPINERAGAGGLYTSIPDLQKWDENFYTGRLGGTEVLKQLQTRGTLNAGQTLAYAWGLQIGEYRGLPIVEHSGSLGGYRAHILRFPAQHASVALLCNVSSVVTATLVRRVADVVVGDKYTKPPLPVPPGTAGSVPGPIADAVSAEKVAAYAGTYYSDEVDATFYLIPGERGLLFSRKNEAEPVVMQPGAARDELRVRGLTIRFQRDTAGKVTSLTVDAGRVRGIKFTKR